MKRIITVLTAILVISAMLVSFTSCGSSAEPAVEEALTTIEAEHTESLTPVNYASDEVLNYFNTVVNSIKVEQPKVYYRYELNVPNDTLRITEKGSEGEETIPENLSSINDAAPAIKDLVLENIKEVSGEVAKGADNSEYVLVKGESWVSNLAIEDIDSATIKEVGDFYYITISFDEIAAGENTESLSKAFNLRDKDEILASEEFAKTSSYLVFNDYSVGYSGCRITAKVNRHTDEVINLNYYKAANVVVDMTGAGTYKDAGDVSVIFTLEDKANFDFAWENELPVSPLETTTQAEPTTASADV